MPAENAASSSGEAVARRALEHFLGILRTLSVVDAGRARIARRMEREVSEVLTAVCRFANERGTHTELADRSRAITNQWLGLSRDALALDADLADLLVVLARHWLLQKVIAARAMDWLRLAGITVRLLAQRENYSGQGTSPDEHTGNTTLANLTTPTIFLALCGFPRGVSPADAEVALHDGSVIGRAPSADWTLPGDAVSRAHVRIAYNAERRAFCAVDLSRNGIAFDGGPDGDLAPGMLLKIPRRGDYQILVHSVFIPALHAASPDAAGGPDDAGEARADTDGADGEQADDSLDEGTLISANVLPGQAAANGRPNADSAQPHSPELGRLIREYVRRRGDCAAMIDCLFTQTLH